MTEPILNIYNLEHFCFVIFAYFLLPLIGGFVIKRTTGHPFALGFSSLLAIILVTLTVFALNLIIAVPIHYAYFLVIAIFIILFLIIVFRSKNILSDFNHPVLWVGLPVIAYFCIFLFTPYDITAWDEYSHWLTMPKQYLLHKQFIDSNFLMKAFTSYTPAWSFYTIQASILAQTELLIEFIILQNLIFAMFCLAAIYDLFRIVFKNHLAPVLSAAIVIIFLAFLKSQLIYPENNLIEFPMHLIYCVIVSYSVFLLRNQASGKAWLGIGFLIAYAYLLKHSYMTLAFYGLVIVALSSWKKELTKKTIILRLGYVLVPFIVAYVTWNIKIRLFNVSTTFSPISFSSFQELLNLFAERGYLFRTGLAALAQLVNNNDNLKFVCLMYLASFFYKPTQKLAVLTASYLGLYFVALIWMYITSFGGFEAHRLMSFTRYITAPVYGVLIITIYYFIELFNIAASKLPKSYQALIQASVKAFVTVILVVFTSINLTTFYSKPPGAPQIVLTESQNLRRLIKRLQLTSPTVRLIDQGGNEFAFVQANFTSVGFDEYFFKAQFGSTFGPAQDNVWRQVYKTQEAFLNAIASDDIIWIIHSDAWMDVALAKLGGLNCQPPFERYFILRLPNGKYECYSK